MIDFDRAATLFGEILLDTIGDRAVHGRLLRDMYGQLGYLTDASGEGEDWETVRSRATNELGAYANPSTRLIISLRDEPDEFGALCKEPSIAVIAHEQELRLIDRRLAGGEWLISPVDTKALPARLLFYSVKGGVGRSTALAIVAADLAASGHNVLIVDLDLEAPGQGSLLLSPNGAPSHGVVDWFAAVAAGAQAMDLVPDMIGACPFTSGSAVVHVVPAVGTQGGDYLSKLARAYAPGSAGETYRGYSFPRKADALITDLTSREPYDVVLIDARAGLHETSGGLLLGLGAKSLIFGVDTPQTFDDYRLMFQALGHAFDPMVGGGDTRGEIKMVHAKAPRDVTARQAFLERSWDLWSNTLYDNEAGLASASAELPFVFDLPDETAPHYPLHIISDERYARFDPTNSAYALSRDAYRPIFGNFLDGVRALLGLPE